MIKENQDITIKLFVFHLTKPI